MFQRLKSYGDGIASETGVLSTKMTGCFLTTGTEWTVSGPYVVAPAATVSSFLD